MFNCNDFYYFICTHELESAEILDFATVYQIYENQSTFETLLMRHLSVSCTTDTTLTPWVETEEQWCSVLVSVGKQEHTLPHLALFVVVF